MTNFRGQYTSALLFKSVERDKITLKSKQSLVIQVQVEYLVKRSGWWKQSSLAILIWLEQVNFVII